MHNMTMCNLLQVGKIAFPGLAKRRDQALHFECQVNRDLGTASGHRIAVLWEPLFPIVLHAGNVSIRARRCELNLRESIYKQLLNFLHYLFFSCHSSYAPCKRSFRKLLRLRLSARARSSRFTLVLYIASTRTPSVAHQSSKRVCRYESRNSAMSSVIPDVLMFFSLLHEK
jgi:hypothetical protein